MKFPPLVLVAVVMITPLLVREGSGGEPQQSILQTNKRKEESTVFPITIKEYASFLAAIAVEEDPHKLYLPAMSGSICLTEEGEGASYQAIEGRADDPMTGLSLTQAMRYCNWVEHGKPNNDIMSTETGTYLFADDALLSINGQADYEVVSLEGSDSSFGLKGEMITSQELPLMMFARFSEKKDSVYPLKRVNAMSDLQERRASLSGITEDLSGLDLRASHKQEVKEDLHDHDSDALEKTFHNKISLTTEETRNAYLKRIHQRKSQEGQRSPEVSLVARLRQNLLDGLQSSGALMSNMVMNPLRRSAPVHVEGPTAGTTSPIDTRRYDAVVKYKKPAIMAAKKRIAIIKESHHEMLATTAQEELPPDISFRKTMAKSDNLIRQLDQAVKQVEIASDEHLEVALQQLQKKVIASGGYAYDFKKLSAERNRLTLPEGGLYPDTE